MYTGTDVYRYNSDAYVYRYRRVPVQFWLTAGHCMYTIERKSSVVPVHGKWYRNNDRRSYAMVHESKTSNLGIGMLKIVRFRTSVCMMMRGKQQLRKLLIGSR